jgi:hypothetical protein
VVDRGTVGPDYQFGAGELQLPPPPNSLQCPADDTYEANDSLMRLLFLGGSVLRKDGVHVSTEEVSTRAA